MKKSKKYGKAWHALFASNHDEHWGDLDYSSTGEHRQQLDKGCFRYVPETRNVDITYDRWRERAYADRRHPEARVSKPRSDAYHHNNW